MSPVTLNDPLLPTAHKDSWITDNRHPGAQNPSHLKQGTLESHTLIYFMNRCLSSLKKESYHKQEYYICNFLVSVSGYTRFEYRITGWVFFCRFFSSVLGSVGIVI
jgi:hypothetical protein